MDEAQQFLRLKLQVIQKIKETSYRHNKQHRGQIVLFHLDTLEQRLPQSLKGKKSSMEEKMLLLDSITILIKNNRKQSLSLLRKRTILPMKLRHQSLSKKNP